MPVTLDITTLQEHNVCSFGQVNFRRKFSRIKTWGSLAVFIVDLRQHSELWDWDEACDKFEVSKPEWRSLCLKLNTAGAPADDEEEEEDYETHQERERSNKAEAWATLYWELMNPSMSANVIQCSRALIEAHDAVAVTRNFAAKHDLSATVDGARDLDRKVRAHINAQLVLALPGILAQAITHFEELERLKKTELATAIHREHNEPPQL